MATVIKGREDRVRNTELIPEVFLGLLPSPLYFCIYDLALSGVAVDEIRLRSGRRASVTSGSENIMLDVVLEQEDMDRIFAAICDDSLYAHAHTINCGYVTLTGGIRVGVVGRAAVEEGRVIGVYDVSGLCFRLPRVVRRVGAPVCDLLQRFAPSRGVLVYSPPCHGKTTLLRSVICQMASGARPWRVAVIDTRDELCFSLDASEACVDVLSGYPRPLGVEIAARSMNAQLMVCDEIGDEEEAEAIVAVQNCGVPLLATAHAASVDSLLQRTGIRRLHESGIFGAYVGIWRRDGESDYLYTIHSHGDADAILQNCGSGDSYSLRHGGCVSAQQSG